MELITLSSIEDLCKHEKNIRSLFNVCFNKPLTSEFWRWGYADNPAGNPVVSLCIDEKKLVGHYAIIPMPLSSNQLSVKSYLSMTTMIAPSHRKLGLFTQLAQLTYDEAKASGAEMVFGFPNDQSAPGFKKSLSWTMIDHDDYVASVTKKQLLETPEDSYLFDSKALHFNYHDKELKKWRLSKPSAHYEHSEGIIYKSYGESVDLIFCESKARLKHLPENKLINILVPNSLDLFKKHKIFDYKFGGIGLNAPFNPNNIHREMLLSDTF